METGIESKQDLCCHNTAFEGSFTQVCFGMALESAMSQVFLFSSMWGNLLIWLKAAHSVYTYTFL